MIRSELNACGGDMAIPDYESRLKNTNRNDSCPCGSGKKYKKCHLSEDEAAQHAAVKQAEEAAAKEAEETGDGSDGEAAAGGPSFVPKDRAGRQNLKGQSSKGGRTVNLPRRSGKA